MGSIQRRILLFLTVLAGCAYVQGQASPPANPSLDSILEEHHVPVDRFSSRELQGPITSWALSKNDQPFLLAWYDEDGSGTLHEPLHVVRYTRKQGVQRADVRGDTDKFRLGGFTTSTPSMCLGSALSTAEVNGLILIGTHINPSAGCVLILRQDMSFQAAVSGWVLGIIDSYLIVHEGEVHFTDSHQGRLGVFDLPRNQWTELYPIKADPAYSAFTANVKAHMPSEKWCQENNRVCDPSNFEIDISDVIVDPATHSFRFGVSFMAYPLEEETGNAVGDEEHSYNCGLYDSKWECALLK